LFFSPQNLVILPVSPEKVIRWWGSYITDPTAIIPETYLALDKGQIIENFVYNRHTYTLKEVGEDFDCYPEVQGWMTPLFLTNMDLRWRGGDKFIQFGDKIPLATQFSNYNKPIWGEISMSLNKMEISDLQANTVGAIIRSDVNMAIKNSFLSEQPLTFPVSVCITSRFTGLPTMGSEVKAGGTVDFTMVLCQSVSNVDTIFIIPFRSYFQHTVCYQPYVENFQLQCGEFGYNPQVPIQTFHTNYETDKNILFNNLQQDVWNYNSSRLFSMPYSQCYQYTPNTFLNPCNRPKGKCNNHVSMNGIPTHNGLYANMDCSNHLIGLPTASQFDFQGGLNSPVNNINFKVQGRFKPPYDMTFSTPWMCVFLTDGIVMIRPDPGSDNAKVIFSVKSITD